jgi:hypothetical protein
MLKQAFNFMQETDRPDVHGETRAKILSLLKEIDAVYKQHVRKSTGMVCDICGKGDTDDIHKVKDLVNGYEHREHMSPRLCYGHSCGWNSSYTKLEYQRKYRLLGLNKKVFSEMLEMTRTVFDEPVLSDEEIDLHFAQYLAKQLQKSAGAAHG